MKTRVLVGSATGAVPLAVLALPLPASAATNAQLSVLHAIPGVTVDVWVDGALTLDDFTPSTLAGPLSLAPATYSVAITAAQASMEPVVRPDPAESGSAAGWPPHCSRRPLSCSSPAQPSPLLPSRARHGPCSPRRSSIRFPGGPAPQAMPGWRRRRVAAAISW